MLPAELSEIEAGYGLPSQSTASCLPSRKTKYWAPYAPAARACPSSNVSDGGGKTHHTSPLSGPATLPT